MKKRLFITATGTDIGKTFITAALASQAKMLGKTVMAYKPVSTGFGLSNDTDVLMQSLKLPSTQANIERVSPWRYQAPLAPSMAARMENRPIDFDALVTWSKKVFSTSEDITLIEITGGIMVPLDDQHTMLDWVEKSEEAALLVTGSYLGTISHTLTALAVLEQRKIPIAGIIINETQDSPVDLIATADELKRWTKAPVIIVKRRASGDDWENVNELKAIFA